MKYAIPLLTFLLLPAASQAAEPTGSIRLCREVDLVEPAQTNLNKAYIRLPAAVLLGDFGGRDDPLAEHRWDLEIILLKPVEMRPGVRCVTVPGIISPLSSVRSVSPKDNRDLEIEGIAKPDGNLNADIDLPESWDWTTSIHGTVEQEFR